MFDKVLASQNALLPMIYCAEDSHVCFGPKRSLDSCFNALVYEPNNPLVA